jgi:hypothetical protein
MGKLRAARGSCSAVRWPLLGGLLLLPLLLPGCESLFLDNPANCVRRPEACGREERCNTETQRCETLDCTVNTALCKGAGEFCDPASRRCARTTCVIDPALCTATQDCVASTGQCVTRSFVLGQPDDHSNVNAAYGMNGPWTSTLIPDSTQPGKTRLVVADSGNNRVLIWNEIPTENRPADAVLGMPDVHTLSATGPYGGVNERSMSFPWSATSDGKNIILGDQFLNRLLIWNQIPTRPSGSEPIPANRLWGQTDFESSQVDSGQTDPNSLGTSRPRVFAESGGGSGFFLADHFNNRVLVFPAVPDGPTAKPSFVLGQPDFVTNTAVPVSQSSLTSPRAAFSDGTRLFVADFNSNRVLQFTLPITANNPMATAVYGQAGFTTAAVNRGGVPGPNTLNRPTAVWQIGTVSRQLFIADQVNHRVLRYPQSDTNADLVLGQASFNIIAPNRGMPSTQPGGMAQPLDVSSDGTSLAVADFSNNRVLLWQKLPTTNGQLPDVVLGQPGPSSSAPNNPPTRSALQFRGPIGVASDGTRLVLSDSQNHRVLLFHRIPRDGQTPPDVVLGQTDFVSNLPNAGMSAPTASTLSTPACVSLDGGRLIVADPGNNRVLIWNQLPSQNAAPADLVIGQPGFLTGTLKPSTTGLNSPQAAVLYEGTLVVGDFGYNRVLLYRNPFAAGATADVVLGQPHLGVAIANNGGQSARSLAGPRELLAHKGKLLVADRNNNRVLIWNALPTSSFTAADVVVGQIDFTSSYTRTDRTRLALPRGILVHNDRLYISAAQQNRILFWNQIPTSSGQRADGVLGQSDFLSSVPNNPDLPWIEKLSAPSSLTVVADQLFIADTTNNRLVVRSLPR